MNREEMAERRLEAMSAAASRWEQKAEEALRATATLQTEGRVAATSRASVDDFLFHQVQKPFTTDRTFLAEAIIGDIIDFVEIAPDQAAADAGRPVARIVELRSNGRVGDAVATGFLIAPNIMVTNWHVFGTPSNAEDCAAQFNYQDNGDGTINDGVVFPVDAGSFFFSDEALDIAIVGLNSDAVRGQGALTSQGAIKIVPAPGKYLVGNPVNIVQHPDGRPKRWASSEVGIRVEPAPGDRFLHYLTDTLPGSSGSPTFNHDWELIAVHHASVPRLVDGRFVRRDGSPWLRHMPESEIDCVANEGVRISKVFELLKAVRLPNAEHHVLLTKLLGDIGFFSEASIRGAVSEGRPSAPVDTSTGGAAERRSPISVVVNGTANFYLGADAPTAPTPPLPIAVPAISSLPAIAATVVEKKVRFDPNYENRKGYDPKFLDGFAVAHPRGPLDEVLKRGNGQLILKYYHYSLVMHRERQLAMWTAANADYHKTLRRKTREEWGEDHWKADPRISGDAQIEDFEFYDPAAKFDKGHLVRRDDVAWGRTSKEEEFGNSDSFHWTNCSPQHEGFNRDMFQYNGLWGELENHITKQARFVGEKCLIFSGPVLDEDDPVHDFGDDIVMQVPKDFWKVIVVVENTDGTKVLRAYGFVLDQTEAIEEYGWERRFNVGKFEEQQLSLRDITALSRVTFDDVIYAADPLSDVVNENLGRVTLESMEDLVLS